MRRPVLVLVVLALGLLAVPAVSGATPTLPVVETVAGATQPVFAPQPMLYQSLDLALPVAAEVRAATVELWDTDWTVAAGHRLELVLASTNATWGLSDTTRATSTLDPSASTITIPLLEMTAAR